MVKYFQLWGPVIVWAALIFTLSSIPTLPKTDILWWDFILKKSAHIFEYAVFYLLILRALHSHPKKYFLALIIAIPYAISDEFHQSFVPGRTAHIRDVGFDTIGAILAYGIHLKKLNKN